MNHDQLVRGRKMMKEGEGVMLDAGTSSRAKAPWKMTGKWIRQSPRKPCQLSALLPTLSFPACPTGQNLSMNSQPKAGKGWGGKLMKEPHTVKSPS